MKARTIVYGGVIAAFYTVLTIVIAPLSYGPIQVRVSNLVKPVALLHPTFALSLAIGTGMSNLFSPFGFWDWGIMPFVEYASAIVCYWLRRVPWLAVSAQSLIVSMGVCVFPLGMGAHLPVAVTVIPVLIPNLIVPLLGYYLIWKREDIKDAVIVAG